MNSASGRKPNRLKSQTSPYLLQHAHNPVDWYPWGGEALARAKAENRPIFLSIGYSACHWCHVMERESFENEETAKLMNELFVNIKVDREERPDLDHIYMSAVQMMTQHGGWPMSVFLTPELKPFYGGTYFPPEDRMGMPSFKKILAGVANAWKTRKEEIQKTAGELAGALNDMNRLIPVSEQLTLRVELVDQATEKIRQNFDDDFGGFGSAPKFFHSMDLRVCLRHWRRTGNEDSLEVVSATLDRWLNGGIYDQLGGGLHRYSTDRQWLVPHFEKMLYDNALCTEVYLEGYQATLKEEWSRAARETLNYVLREMTSEAGGFFSTQDADSEGVEGKFYVWSKAEIEEVLNRDVAEAFCKVYDVTEDGNWEHQNILNRPQSLELRAQELKLDKAALEDTLALAARKLLARRNERIAPFRDEKILVSWNGLMIHTMALGALVLADERYYQAAAKAARWLLEHCTRPTTRPQDNSRLLFHTYKDGQATCTAYLDDYANLLNGLLTLFESDGNPEWLKQSLALAETMLDQFWDAGESMFYFTARDHEALIHRPREVHDGATPSATGMAITALARLGLLTGKTRYGQRAEAALGRLSRQMSTIPTASGQLHVALEILLADPLELVFFQGSDAEENAQIAGALHSRFLPNKVVVPANETTAKELGKYTELVDGRSAQGGKPTLYICRKMTCQAPVVGADAILTAIGKLK